MDYNPDPFPEIQRLRAIRLDLNLSDGENETLKAVMSKPSTAVMEQALAVMHAQGGSEAFARKHRIPEMSELVTLGGAV